MAMESTSTSEEPGDSYYDPDGHNDEITCSKFLFVMYVVVFGLMCLFGLIGNTLSFLVLQWERHGHVATFLLQVMAVLDNLFLLTTGFSQIYSANVVYFQLVEFVQPYIQVYVWPLVHITQLGTIWITVLIAFNRYVAICRPFQAPAICTMGRVRLQVGIMICFCIVYCIPRFLERHIVFYYDDTINATAPLANMTALLGNKYYSYVYENGLYTLIVFLMPLLILIILNACLIKELWRARQRALQRQLPAFMTAEDQDNNLTLVMIVIVIIFLICQTPALINNLLFVMGENEEWYRCGEPYFYFYHISNLFISANSSLNFVIYCIFRRQFRQRLRAFCGFCESKDNQMANSEYTQSFYFPSQL